MPPHKSGLPVKEHQHVTHPDTAVPLLEDNGAHFSPIINVLRGLISHDDLEKAVSTALVVEADTLKSFNIKDAYSFLTYADDLLRWIPTENFKAKNVYEVICVFYFILDQASVFNLQTEVNPSQVGKSLTPLSSWIVDYAQHIGLFMDTPESINEKSLQTFYESKLYALHEAHVPEGGWKTFNDFFARKLKDGARPISDPHNDRIITYPADCTLVDTPDNQSIMRIDNGTINIKGLVWTIQSLLRGSKYENEFHEGVWMHAFLNTFNYHRQHTPVSGKVLEAKVIQGAAYLEVDSTNASSPVRTIAPPREPKGNEFFDLDAPDRAGYQFLQTRGLIVVDNPTLGLVAVLPIGMAMVSSVKLTTKAGDHLKKGDEISYFQFGGSDIIVVFQKKAGLSPENFKVSPLDNEGKQTYSKVGQVLAEVPK